MQIKKGADLRFLRQEVSKWLLNVEAVFSWHLPAAYQFVITSGADGKHKTGSKHYKNLAVDIRIWWMDKKVQSYADQAQKELILADLGKLLPEADFDLVWHAGSHLHMEYDP
jgi:hypothetical protein